MKTIKSFLNTLEQNNLVKLIVKAIVPKSVLGKTLNYLSKDKSISTYFENTTVFTDDENKDFQGFIPVFYWVGKPNFGDLIGPYIISKITGKPVLNIKNLQYPGIMAVGSILQMLDRENMVVWGSGLMYKPRNEHIKDFKKYKPEFLSVRGHETAKCLKASGIDVPDQSFYGDPALILPLFYNPSISKSKKIGICPHFKHKSYFLKHVTDKESFEVIDVQKDVEAVVDSIRSSTVCISTSLHGLIVAQAYNIPWVWLEIFDNNLGGDDFKFKDFFSTLNESQVSHIRVKMKEVKHLDYKVIAEKACLPDKLYNEHLILNSLKVYLNKKPYSSNN